MSVLGITWASRQQGGHCWWWSIGEVKSRTNRFNTGTSQMPAWQTIYSRWRKLWTVYMIKFLMGEYENTCECLLSEVINVIISEFITSWRLRCRSFHFSITYIPYNAKYFLWLYHLINCVKCMEPFESAKLIVMCLFRYCVFVFMNRFADYEERTPAKNTKCKMSLGNVFRHCP